MFWRGDAPRAQWWGLPVFRCSALRDDAMRAITMVTGLFLSPFQSILLMPSVCCYADFSPPAPQTFFFLLVEEVWNPSRLKGEVREGVESRLRRRRRVGGGQQCYGSFLWCIKENTLNTRSCTLYLSFRWFSVLYSNEQWYYFCSSWINNESHSWFGIRATAAPKHCGKCTCSRSQCLDVPVWRVINNNKVKHIKGSSPLAMWCCDSPGTTVCWPGRNEERPVYLLCLFSFLVKGFLVLNGKTRSSKVLKKCSLMLSCHSKGQNKLLLWDNTTNNRELSDQI